MAKKPSIFAQVASKLKAEKQSLIDEVMGLDTEIDSMASQGKEVIQQHRAAVGELKDGIEEMRTSITELRGNSTGEEEDDTNVTTFSGKTGTSNQ